MVDNGEQRYNELADFLKTRRARISPTQLGILVETRRRTPGLRREEVASLAGIGLTWYTWLEQGRPIQVSAQVIESLSRVLLLDKQERNHLYILANQPVPSGLPGYEGTVNPALQHVLDSFELGPALITDQRWNVIAWNNAARLIFGEYSEMNARERNIVWAMFTNSYYKELFVDWEVHAKSLLGRFRSTTGRYIEDSWLNQFISDLKKQSAEFNTWWPLHEILNESGVCGARKQLNHPLAGVLDFESSSFDVHENSLKMFVHIPVSGTDTEAKMKELLNA